MSKTSQANTCPKCGINIRQEIALARQEGYEEGLIKGAERVKTHMYFIDEKKFKIKKSLSPKV